MVLIWDPKRSNLIEETINELVKGIKAGEISPEISPSTLTSLGDKFKKFYFASFRRVNRVGWSEHRFPATGDDPSGFQSFVSELRGKVGEGVLINAKRNKSMYISHTDDQISKILDFRELYMEDEITSGEAVSSLKEDYNILLSDSRKEFYFPERNGKKAHLDSLISRLRSAKKQVEIDLTNTECVRGLLFEGIVGMHLMSRFGPENVETQVRKPVFYSDLLGGRHREVYLDYVVDGQNIEVKLRNTLENILDSVLPQTFAISSETGALAKSTVICRTRNPELDALYRENISLAEEAEKMGINEAGRKIQDVFDYLSIEELIEGDPNEDIHKNALQVLDGFEAKDTPAMKTYAKAFVRISDNPDALSDKYRILVNLMKRGKVLSEEDLTVLFGEKKNHRISRDVSRRIEIIKDITRKRDYRMLVEMYNLEFKRSVSTLDDDSINKLYDMRPESFTSLCKTIMEERQQKSFSRKPKKQVTSDDILEFHRRAYERKTKEAMNHAKSLSNLVEKKLDLLCIPIYENAGMDLKAGGNYHKNELPAAVSVLSKVMNLPAAETEKQLLEVLEEAHRNYIRVSDVMKNISGHIKDHVRDIRQHLLKDGKFYQEGLEDLLNQYTKYVEEQRQNFDNFKGKLLERPAAAAIETVIEKIKQKKMGVSKRERDIFARLGIMIEGRLENAILDGNISYFDSVSEVTEISEFLAWDTIEGYAAEVKRIDLSKDTPENCWLFAGAEKHNRLFASTVCSMDKMIVRMVSGFRCALNEQTLYYKYRGYFMKNIDSLLLDPKEQIRFQMDHVDFACENSSEILGYTLPGCPIDIENNLSLIQVRDADLDNETFARFIEYIAKKMTTVFYNTQNDIDRKHAPVDPMERDERNDFFRKHARILVNDLAKTNAFNYALTSDFLSKKAYNMRVLTRFGDEAASHYRCSNPIDKEKLLLPLPEFMEYIKDIDSCDEEVFRSCLTGTNGYSNHTSKVEAIVQTPA